MCEKQWEIGWKIETKFLRHRKPVKTVCQLNVNHLSVYFYDPWLFMNYYYYYYAHTLVVVLSLCC